MRIMGKKLISETKFLNLWQTVYLDKEKHIRNWFWVGRPKEQRAVSVVAQVDDLLAVIKEYRVPIEDYEWGFPAGLIDNDEPPEEAARRELKEETGLEITQVHKVSPFVYNSAGLTDESISMIYVSAKGDLTKKHLESSEDIEPFLMTQTEVGWLLTHSKNKFGAKSWIILDFFATYDKLPI